MSFSAINVKNFKTNTVRSFVSIEQYNSHGPSITFDENYLLVNTSCFPFFFRKLYKEKQIADNVKALLERVDDKSIIEFAKVLEFPKEKEFINMNHIFDWSSQSSSLQVMQKLKQKLEDKSLAFSYLFLYILDELVKACDEHIENNKKSIPKKIDLNVYENDLFYNKQWDSNAKKIIRCDALIEDENIFCEVINQNSTNYQRFLFLQKMEIKESKLTSPMKKNSKLVSECISPPLVSFVDKSEFMFDLFLSNPISEKNGYVDFFMILPEEDSQSYYHVFLNSATLTLQIRKVDQLVENILNPNFSTSSIYEYIVDETKMKELQGSYKEEFKLFLDFSAWESISEESNMTELFHFAKFLEYFLSNTVSFLPNKKSKQSFSSNMIDKKIIFKNGEDLFFALNVGNTKNLQFEIYESAFVFAPILMNRFQFIDQLKIQKGPYALDLLDFENMDTMNVNHVFELLSYTHENKKKSVENDLANLLEPGDMDNLNKRPSLVELQLFHFGLLNGYKEIEKIMLPLLHGFQIKNVELQHYEKGELKTLLENIGSSHYSKCKFQFDIEIDDCLFFALTNQVNLKINLDESSDEEEYRKVVQKLRKTYKKITIKDLYQNYINFTKLIDSHYNYSDVDTELPQKNNQSPTKRKRGRPKAEDTTPIVIEESGEPNSKIMKSQVSTVKKRGRPPKSQKETIVPEKKTLDLEKDD